MCCNENPLDELEEECYEYDDIDETNYEINLGDEESIDPFWEKGWQIGSDELLVRADFDWYEDRIYRAFPTRYRLKDFRLNKSLRRVLRINSDLKTIARPFRSTPGKDALYTRHYNTRFGGDKNYSLKRTFDYLKYTPVSLTEICVFDREKLLAATICEVGDRSLMSNRAFWDVNFPKRSLGIFTVLLEMQLAVKLGKEFFYLGYYLEQNPNFHYKIRFPGAELWDWDNNDWIDVRANPERIREMINYKFRCKDDDEQDEPSFYLELLRLASKHQPDISGVALAGSRARGEERQDSDFDIIILTTDAAKYINDERQEWARNVCHRFREQKIETNKYGKTLRAFYKNGLEFEFNFLSPEWAAFPVKEETRRTVREGFQIIHDPQGVLEKLKKAVLGENAGESTA